MKTKILYGVIVSAIAFSSGTLAGNYFSGTQVSPDKIYINGQKQSSMTAGLTQDNKTFVPLRGILEKVGVKVEWKDVPNSDEDRIELSSYTPTNFIQKNAFPNGSSVKHALQSTPEIERVARAITSGLPDRISKAKVLYDYIIDVNSYDFGATEGTEDGAIKLFTTQTGICYDYASLFTVMAHSAGIPVRLVGGFVLLKDDKFSGHAWNNIQLESGEWIAIDTTWGEDGEQYGWNFKESDSETDRLNPGDRLPTWLFAQYETID